MKFGVFYELQLPKPWNEGDEHRLFHEALEQIVLADRLGYDHAWEVEHHFLDEYSHSSAPEVFLAAAASVTKNIRLGHGIRQVIPNYNHPARTAEGLATLDIMSNGRVEFGIGEGATRLELGGFNIPAKEKRAMAIEAGEQIANMMVLDPYPGFEGKYFSMPCRNVLPKPVQHPHPPMWMACTNRDTIRVAASLGVGALAFSFVDPEEAKNWSDIYYGIIKSEECRPIGHSVNANIAMVSNFSLHHDREEAIRRGHEGFEFFGYALNALVAHDTVPGRTDMWGDYIKARGNRTQEVIDAAKRAEAIATGIGTPDDMRAHLRAFQDAGVDQVIFMQQAGRNKHEHICESLELFAKEVMPEFKAEVAAREARKREELAPYIEAALKRKNWMKPLEDHEIPVVQASVKKAQVNQGTSAAE
ncbi:LLM class flavin-dependent oxidoreductase [Parvibaculum sp.]|jgi:alkanesulfonate monooxygenase SsuD/methylene tetrahydromethanopterin reductase-like flavin-dependent oxidoreductase (luciferase family)|uniref:LLM class flavin-dependent oxidoreductase n=1 Tax=Parvibaculum sp. TaxID=2024848 RepID=UPI000C635FFF|nr:LLM class flavin-dependent oxidoreductase [Parvibaculum sp.]MAU62538.1 LLM class flavin-dependent oxidoreductase [Parvibaculum sp.]MBO6666523.1 LLM class flavin-dependent oxidoreductase [Parvibaculum sp.]MBO6690882.1 LLM class flavin-dependent oxidoreductase [Parvibaculum sp.]MBO6713144.1 LLM class flavin-dependent oxidoreductase [Parvibaculum sp.]|tara:strand:+ start:7080 stop:8330 length:1251 start_codon:yes stop_codon:yes gene_type:complete